jgi:Protein of unknown function (DUF3866)
VLTLRRGRVSAVVERHEGLVRVEVDGVPCVAYPDLTGPVALEDDVLVNVQARELELGSGGFDVLYANLTRGLGLPAAERAHVMKLPYTPLQFARRHAEEDGPIAELIEGLPVVCCSLHSQVAPVCAALAGLRVVYAQLPGGALPVALSDAVRALRERRLLEAAVGVSACFGGDVDCVTVYSALGWAGAAGADVVVCSVGPGIVGTATLHGHGGMAAAVAASAASELGGSPVLALRLSTAERRDRHRGLSHHMEGILSPWGPPVRLAWPAGCPVEHSVSEGADHVDVADWQEACAGLPLSHMGRGPDEDPWFFAAAFAAGRLARALVR